MSTTERPDDPRRTDSPSYRSTRAFATERRAHRLPESLPEERLPCDVLVAPATIFRKGVNLSTLLLGIRQRIGRDVEPLELHATIARLSAELEAAREALGPFAKEAEFYNEIPGVIRTNVELNVDDLRRARAAHAKLSVPAEARPPRSDAPPDQPHDGEEAFHSAARAVVAKEGE